MERHDRTTRPRRFVQIDDHLIRAAVPYVGHFAWSLYCVLLTYAGRVRANSNLGRLWACNRTLAMYAPGRGWERDSRPARPATARGIRLALKRLELAGLIYRGPDVGGRWQITVVQREVLAEYRAILAREGAAPARAFHEQHLAAEVDDAQHDAVTSPGTVVRLHRDEA